MVFVPPAADREGLPAADRAAGPECQARDLGPDPDPDPDPDPGPDPDRDPGLAPDPDPGPDLGLVPGPGRLYPRGQDVTGLTSLDGVATATVGAVTALDGVSLSAASDHR